MTTPADRQQLFVNIERIISRHFPTNSITDISVLSGGLINLNLRVDLASHDPAVVVRVYRDGADVCRKEFALHQLVSASVPVAQVLYVEPDGLGDVGSYAILEFIEGISFQELKRTSNKVAIQKAATSIGKTLAEIGRFQFSTPGKLTVEHDQLIVGDPFIEGENPIPQLVDQFLSSPTCQDRLGVQLTDRIHEFAWESASLIPDLDQRPTLVHSDFGNRNILVHEKNGEWKVAAVLDWEFAFSGSPLLDVGHFLRYERMNEPVREPYFSDAFVEHGGTLPDNWREIVRLIDLTALVQCLTIENLQSDVEAELIELIVRTVKRY